MLDFQVGKSCFAQNMHLRMLWSTSGRSRIEVTELKFWTGKKPRSNSKMCDSRKNLQLVATCNKRDRLTPNPLGSAPHK